MFDADSDFFQFPPHDPKERIFRSYDGRFPNQHLQRADEPSEIEIGVPLGTSINRGCLKFDSCAHESRTADVWKPIRVAAGFHGNSCSDCEQ